MKVILTKNLPATNEFKLGGFVWKYEGVGTYSSEVSEKELDTLNEQYVDEDFKTEVKPEVKKAVRKPRAKKVAK